MNNNLLAGIFFSLLFNAVFSFPLHSESIVRNVGRGTNQVRVRSAKEIRDQNVVKQSYESTCGAASLATIFTYFINDKTSETDVLKIIGNFLTEKQKVEKEDLSFEDLSKVVQLKGYKPIGGWVKPENLPRLHGPVIVYVKPQGKDHFSVLKGIRGNRVYLADPSLGNVQMPVYRFLDMWPLNKQGEGRILMVDRTDGKLPKDYPLKLKVGVDRLEAEAISVRQMRETTNPYVRFPQLLR